MKFKLITLALSALIISGCAKERIVYKDRVVYVPKIVHAEVPFAANVKKPKYLIHKINKDSTIDEVLNYTIITIKQQDGYADRLEIALKPYQDPKNVELEE